MLSIYFGDGLDGVIMNPDVFFDNQYEPSWLMQELSKKMILDVDKSEVLGEYCIMSPVLGQIPPETLSGGVKTLMLMENRPDKVFNASYCGNNCAKWIQEIGRRHDVTIRLGYPMKFRDNIEFKCVNNGEVVKGRLGYVETILQFL